MAVIRRHIKYREDFMRLYNDGLSDPEIAKVLGQFPQVIYNWRKMYGLPANYVQHSGATGSHADTIRTMHAAGSTDSEIAASIGVSRLAVLNFRKREGLETTFRRSKKSVEAMI